MNNFIFVLAIVGVASGSDEMAGPGRRPGPPPPPPPPPFLENLPEEARKEFFAIVLNKDEKIADQMQKILTWAQKYGVEVQEFNANVTKLMDEVKKNATELISALPSALEKLSAIVSNQDQTVTELKDAIKALSAENPKVFRALMLVLGEFKPKHGGRPHKFKGPKGGPEAEIIEFQGFPRGGFPMGGPDSETEFNLPRGLSSTLMWRFL
ncbi:unnamed protein product [Haemonchus placei]|uniref:DUF148 domain-containing protein n=1 Tax=Haemonchus placei TaxID=6290 RepID=A0A0N4WFZ4_HAEPC|nr:unnamed protein product [Haemonchus placei]